MIGGESQGLNIDHVIVMLTSYASQADASRANKQTMMILARLEITLYYVLSRIML